MKQKNHKTDFNIIAFIKFAYNTGWLQGTIIMKEDNVRITKNQKKIIHNNQDKFCLEGKLLCCMMMMENNEHEKI